MSPYVAVGLVVLLLLAQRRRVYMPPPPPPPPPGGNIPGADSTGFVTLDRFVTPDYLAARSIEMTDRKTDLFSYQVGISINLDSPLFDRVYLPAEHAEWLERFYTEMWYPASQVRLTELRPEHFALAMALITKAVHAKPTWEEVQVDRILQKQADAGLVLTQVVATIAAALLTIVSAPAGAIVAAAGTEAVKGIRNGQELVAKIQAAAAAALIQEGKSPQVIQEAIEQYMKQPNELNLDWLDRYKTAPDWPERMPGTSWWKPQAKAPGADSIASMFSDLFGGDGARQPFTDIPKGQPPFETEDEGPKTIHGIVPRHTLFLMGRFGGWDIPWWCDEMVLASARHTAELRARVYRAMDLLACLLRPNPSVGMTRVSVNGETRETHLYWYTNPRYGNVMGSIFPPTDEDVRILTIDVSRPLTVGAPRDVSTQVTVTAVPDEPPLGISPEAPPPEPTREPRTAVEEVTVSPTSTVGDMFGTWGGERLKF